MIEAVRLAAMRPGKNKEDDGGRSVSCFSPLLFTGHIGDRPDRLPKQPAALIP